MPPQTFEVCQAHCGFIDALQRRLEPILVGRAARRDPYLIRFDSRYRDHQFDRLRVSHPSFKLSRENNIL